MRSFFRSFLRVSRFSIPATIFAASAFATSAHAQQPGYPPPGQYPQQPPPGYQPYPQQPPPGYGPAPGGYPQQPPPGYAPQQPPPGYGPPPGYPQQPPPGYGPPPGYPQQPPPGYGPPPGYPQQPPPVSQTRDPAEMTPLYVTTALWGVGSGIWLDSVFKLSDPGVAIILPIVLGAGAPIGAYFWDSQAGPLHRGVPSAVSGGLVLGAVEGISIAGVQWEFTRQRNKDWPFATKTTVTWIFATGGGVGGWAFGEAIRPDPRNVGFIVDASAWGAGSGAMFGIAVAGKGLTKAADGAAVAGLIGYNAGIVGAGAISLGHTASWEAQKWMWGGYGIGALAGCLVFPLYLFSDSDPQHGFIGPALGGLAGAAIAGALTWNLQDAPGHAKNFKPPFDIGIMPVPRLDPALGITTASQGTMLTGSGTF
jgi:hypothetical protein